MKTMVNPRHNLLSVIGKDLKNNGKIPLFLLLIIVISALAVVSVTNKTRLLTTQHERLVVEHESMDIEWRNLILEENVLGDRSRVERIAVEKLKMRYVDPTQENIVVIRK